MLYWKYMSMLILQLCSVQSTLPDKWVVDTNKANAQQQSVRGLLGDFDSDACVCNAKCLSTDSISIMRTSNQSGLLREFHRCLYVQNACLSNDSTTYPTINLHLLAVTITVTIYKSTLKYVFFRTRSYLHSCTL